MASDALARIRAGGPFVGKWKAQSRVTVETGFTLHTSSGPQGNFNTDKLPIRWFQREDNSQVEAEIPNIKSVQITRDLTQQAATVQIAIYNQKFPGDVPGDFTASAKADTLGDPGWFSWSYGSTAEAQARWNQQANPWQNVLRENALIRVYQGYGAYNSDGTPMRIPDAVAAGYLLLKGVFLLDNPMVESNGILTLNGRDTAKLLIDQQTVPPLIPKAKYPLNYLGPGQNVSQGAQEFQAGSTKFNNAFPGSASPGANAVDANTATAWISTPQASASDFAWIQFDVTGQSNAVYIDAQWGPYVCYVSVYANVPGAGLAWRGQVVPGGPTFSTIMHMNIPANSKGWYVFDQFYQAQVVRLWFTQLHPYGGGYSASVHEVNVGEQPAVAINEVVMDLDPTPSKRGYRMFGADGSVFAFGDATYYGDLKGTEIPLGIAGGAGTPTNKGYWLCDSDGYVYPYGDAVRYGHPDPATLTAPVIAMRRTNSGHGYWECTQDGNVYVYGDATSFGRLNQPGVNIVDFCVRPQGDGYWMLEDSGDVHAFGHAVDYGHDVLRPYTAAFLSMDCSPSGNGYWLMDRNAEVWARGDATFAESVPQNTSAWTFTGVIRSCGTGHGYWIVSEEGFIWALGGATWYGSLTETVDTKPTTLPADYKDYSQIIEDLALWSGFWLYPSSGKTAVSIAPPVYGNIETTGVTDILGPLGIQFFDKRPVIDVMTDIASFVGYLVRVDDSGALRFEAPNFWKAGNFYDDGTAVPNSAGPFPVIDEKYTLSDYQMTQSDQDLRSPIVVAVTDPYLWGGAPSGTNVTTYVPPYTPLLKGLTKSAMYAVPLQVDAKDQQYFAELIALRCWFQARTGSVTAWCDPTIEVDDQVQIFERQSGETNIHYVQAMTTTWDDTGKFEMQLTTYWLGGNDANWAVTSDLGSLFPHAAGTPTTTRAAALRPKHFTAADGTEWPTTFTISSGLAARLGQSGAKTTSRYNDEVRRHS